LDGIDFMHAAFTIPPLWQVTRRLAEVARGAAAPDLIIRGVRPVCVLTERILPESEIWISHGRIAAIKPIGAHPQTDVPSFDGNSALLGPGLIDAHVHIESSMMTACAYAEAALLNGTTTIFCDSHEIGNVCDTAGVEWMLADAREAALNIFLTVPSTVPATNPQIETAGGDLTPEKIGALFDAWPEAVALGEKMDFVAVCSGEARSHAIIQEALKRNRPVCGHIYGRENVAAYAASGVTDTHEAVTGEIADDLLTSGVWIFLRGGNPKTPWHSLPQAIKAITERGCSTKRVCLCTDDRDADDLFLFGMDWVLGQARHHGLSWPIAWSMGSLHAATRYHMDGETGSLGAGRRADLVLMDDSGKVLDTWLSGQQVVANRQITPRLEDALAKPYRYPAPAYKTVQIPANPKLLPAPPPIPGTVNVIGIVAGIETNRVAIPWFGADSWSEWMARNDLCHVAILERYAKDHRVAHGFLQNFGLTQGAVASSVGHDAHNIIVAGTHEADMLLAVETLAKTQGGVCVVQDGQVKAHVPLPVAGLISDLRAPAVAAQTETLKQAWTAAGCRLPYMGFNLIPLSVIPEFRITDQGLVQVSTMALVPLFEPSSSQS
jgi:adenine deaminase